MFLEIASVLTPAELTRLREIARTSEFVDGRISNPQNQTKNNLQLHGQGGAAKESSLLLAHALRRSEPFRNYTFPNRFAPPLMCRYVPGMSYGRHSDAAFLSVDSALLRADVACTVFIAEPSAYEGGELTIHLGTQSVSVKGAAGSAVVYPSTTIHEVRPVTRGERLVAITFVESQIADERKRDLLYTLNEVVALEGLSLSWDSRVRLEQVRQSLHRMWAQ
ncbi:MAG TPA: Fe2+-dependent dioxygenase [Steroidobacteraceae bacterium]|jgi:PKHD-type hydroxylase